MERTAVWKSRPVFVTSTFQDMQAERDYLRSHVFPSLEEWLIEKRRHLEWIDLRVGVASAAVKEEERELHVLKVCLAEVERSRPFLIALIGDRYGWVPPRERIAAAAAEAGFTAEIADRSVTDLEIDFGVFHDRDQRRRCLFFLRKPLPYREMPPEKAAAYSEEYAKDEQAAARRERLDKLKARIRTEFPDRWFEYGGDWKAGGVTGLEDFGREVEAKIKQALEEEMAAEPSALAEPSVEDVDRAELADYAEDRARDFVGRQDVLAEIEVLLTSPAVEGTPWGLCITGEAGSGKSALFGALYQGLAGVETDDTARKSEERQARYARLKQINALVLAHSAGISPRAASVEAMLRRWIGELAEFLGVPTGLSDKAGADDIEAAFASLLGRAALKKRVIVLADALDQFEPTSRGRFVTWLPKLWHPNARFIATAIPGDAGEALAKRLGMTLRPMPPLEADEARKIAEAISARYHRELEPEVLDSLISGAGERWRNPLWLVLAVEELNLLDADDFKHAIETYAGHDYEKLRAYMCKMARDFPPDVPGLYRQTFSRAAKVFGKETTQIFLGLVAVSRSGWRESDFRVLLPKLGCGDWDELRFAQLRRSFRGQMRQRGGQWDFAHSQMRAAAKAWLTEIAGAAETALHTALGDHLLALPTDDPLHISETMRHLMEGDNWQIRSANYYGSASLTAEEAAGATSILAELVLTAEEDNSINELLRIEALLEAPDLTNDARRALATRVLFDLYDQITPQARQDTLGKLAKSAQQVLAQLTISDPDNAGWQRDLSVSWLKIGDVLEAQGNLSEALKAYRDGNAIAERLTRSDPGHAGWQRDLSVSWIRIGDILVSQGNLSEAIKAFRDSHAILERLARSDPGNAGWQLSTSYERIGNVLFSQGNLPEALKSYRDSFAILERLARSDPGSAGCQRDLSVLYIKLGDVLAGKGNLPEALKAYRESLAILEHLARSDSGNAGWQRDLSVSHDRIGNVLVDQSNLPEALKAFRDSLAIRERLAKSDPGNAGWQRDLSVSYIKLGDVLVKQGNLTEALKAFRDSLAIRERLARSDPGNMDWQRNLSVSWIRIGDILVSQGNLPEALKNYRDSLTIANHLVRSDLSNADWQRDLSISYGRIGEVMGKQNLAVEAVEHYRCALDITEKLMAMDPTNLQWQKNAEIFRAALAAIASKK